MTPTGDFQYASSFAFFPDHTSMAFDPPDYGWYRGRPLTHFTTYVPYETRTHDEVVETAPPPTEQRPIKPIPNYARNKTHHIKQKKPMTFLESLKAVLFERNENAN